MRHRLFQFGMLLAASAAANAQDLAPKSGTKSGIIKSKPSEVTVVLDDEGIPLVPPDEDQPKGDSASKGTPIPKAETAKPDPVLDDISKQPVLVTGKPPEHAELVADAPPDPGDPEKGLSIHVEKIQGGNGPIDPQKVKLSFPFPATPLAAPPPGWRFDATPNSPPFYKEAELGPGSKITLKIHPHILVPIADGTDTFSVNEPGFDPALGLRQTGAVGTILATSVAQLDDDSVRMGEAIDRLQQLLASLPAPEVPAAAPPAAVPVKDPVPPKKPR